MKTTKRWINTKQQKQDAKWACATVVLVYIWAVNSEMAEHLTAWFRHFEFMQLDELSIAAFAAALACLWFSHRRMRELLAEMQRCSLAEAASQRNRQLFQMLFEAGLSGNFVCTMQGEILLCNQAFHCMSGSARAQVDSPEPANRPLPAKTMLNLKAALGDAWDALEWQLRGTSTLDIAEMSLHHPDGRPWIVMARFRLVEAEGALQHPVQQSQMQQGQALQGNKEIHGYFIDITEQSLAEKELEQLLNENQALARNAMQAQEEERRYLAREIHDDVGQYLTAIRLDAAALMDETTSGQQASRNAGLKSRGKQANDHTLYAQRISQHAQHIQRSIKALIGRLRPPALDEYGLVTALQQLVASWKQQHAAVQCTLQLDAQCNPPEHISIAAYRMVQESLTNIARHAQAANISICLSQSQQAGEHRLQLTVMDDGIGMGDGMPWEYLPHVQPASAPENPQAITQPGHPGRGHEAQALFNVAGKGFGLAGMRERIEATGGIFSIQNRVSGGVLLTASMPFVPVQTPIKTHEVDARSAA